MSLKFWSGVRSQRVWTGFEDFEFETKNSKIGVMKFLAAIILTALLSFIGGLYLPWWSIAIAALLVAIVIHQKAGKAFFAGFLSVFLLWGVLAWWISMKNEGILASKIASVLPLGGSAIVLILVTGLIGGLVAGFAAMSGSYLGTSKR